MPTNKRFSSGGTTPNAHKALTPTQRQEEHSRLVQATVRLINERVGTYMKEHSKDNRWNTLVRAYYTSLITGTKLSGSLKIDAETKQLVYGWVSRGSTRNRPPASQSRHKEAQVSLNPQPPHWRLRIIKFRSYASAPLSNCCMRLRPGVRHKRAPPNVSKSPPKSHQYHKIPNSCHPFSVAVITVNCGTLSSSSSYF